MKPTVFPGMTCSSVLFMLIMLMLAYATSLHAMNIGNIKLLSYFSEPLHAIIPIHNATNTDLASLDISLENKQYYKAQKLDWNPLYPTLDLSVQVMHHQAYIVIRSAQNIKELMLSFILKFEWLDGKSLRTYDILIRPRARVAQVDLDLVNKHLQPMPTRLLRLTENLFAYGPTTENDTLAAIATGFQKHSILDLRNIETLLISNNPQAFKRKNGQLKIGYFLRFHLDPKTISQSTTDKISHTKSAKLFAQLKEEIVETKKQIEFYRIKNQALKQKLQSMEKYIEQQIRISSGK